MGSLQDRQGVDEMGRLTAKLLTALAMALLSLARWLDGNGGSGNTPPTGPRRPLPWPPKDAVNGQFKVLYDPPGRLEVIRLGLAILFSSARFGVIGV
jgi:hypothetical protein